MCREKYRQIHDGHPLGWADTDERFIRTRRETVAFPVGSIFRLPVLDHVHLFQRNFAGSAAVPAADRSVAVTIDLLRRILRHDTPAPAKTASGDHTRRKTNGAFRRETKRASRRDPEHNARRKHHSLSPLSVNLFLMKHKTFNSVPNETGHRGATKERAAVFVFVVTSLDSSALLSAVFSTARRRPSRSQRRRLLWQPHFTTRFCKERRIYSKRASSRFTRRSV